VEIGERTFPVVMETGRVVITVHVPPSMGVLRPAFTLEFRC
jgi:hypothetical protein